jgi:hypothetical protein
MNMKALLVLYLLGCGPAASAGVEEPILPPDGYREAWKKSGSPKVFTSADLYGYIDGGAEIFFEFGFEQLAVQSYTGELKSPAAPSVKTQLKVEMYRMTDPIAAAGIYLLKCGNEKPDPSFKERHTINRFQLTFKRDRYFVLVNSIDGNESARPAMLDFGRFIAGRIPPERPFAAVPNLPQEGLIQGSVRLARGPFALQSIYTLGEGDILQLHPGRTAVAARYRDAAGEYTRIAADYRIPETSRKTFAGLRKNLDSYLKVESESRDSFVFKDYAGRYGKASLSGSVITILVNLSRKP